MNQKFCKCSSFAASSETLKKALEQKTAAGHIMLIFRFLIFILDSYRAARHNGLNS